MKLFLDSAIIKDIDEEEGLEHKIVTNLSCQQFGSIVHVYHGK